MMKSIGYIVIAALVLVGCGSKEEEPETKSADVKVNISQEQQDKLAADLKGFVPDKKK